MAASVWQVSGWCTTLMAGVADRYFAQGLPWLIPIMPHEASHSFIQGVRVSIHLRLQDMKASP